MTNITGTAQAISNIFAAIATGNVSIILASIGANAVPLITIGTVIYSIILKGIQHKEVLSAINLNAAPKPNPIVEMMTVTPPAVPGTETPKDVK